MANDLTWPAVKMSKMMDITPRRLRQLAFEGIVPKAGRDRYRPFEVNVAYIRFLRDRVESPELSNSEFFQAKLAKLKSEREKIELEMQITRAERIPIEDALAAAQLVFGEISAILKANLAKILTEDQINEIFDEMRRVTDWLEQKAAEVEIALPSCSVFR